MIINRIWAATAGPEPEDAGGPRLQEGRQRNWLRRGCTAAFVVIVTVLLAVVGGSPAQAVPLDSPYGGRVELVVHCDTRDHTIQLSTYMWKPSGWYSQSASLQVTWARAGQPYPAWSNPWLVTQYQPSGIAWTGAKVYVGSGTWYFRYRATLQTSTGWTLWSTDVPVTVYQFDWNQARWLWTTSTACRT
jgi:hypothetical protein